jgi:hypothetical protein
MVGEVRPPAGFGCSLANRGMSRPTSLRVIHGVFWAFGEIFHTAGLCTPGEPGGPILASRRNQDDLVRYAFCLPACG